MVAADRQGPYYPPPAARRTALLGILWAGLLTALTACTPAPPEPLRIAAGPFAGYEPLYLARDLGLLDPDAVRLVEYAPGSQSLRAYRNGVVDGAALTLDEVLILARQGYSPRVVAVLSFSRGADMVIARPEITSLTELRGRRVGVENTALGGYFLSRVLYFAGVGRSEVEVVPMELAEHPRAFRDGRVDALITFNVSAEDLDEMGAVKLFDSSLIPGEIVDVLAVREEALHRSPQAVASVLRGWAGALEYLDREPEDAIARMAPRTGMTPAQFRETLEGVELPDLAQNRALFSGHPPPLQNTVEDIMRFMLAQGLLSAPVDASELIAPLALRAASPEWRP
jgi:NitT/TauT family transport system substrate-binding protein